MTTEFPRTPPAEQDDTLSLRQQLVNWLFTPLFLLLLFSTVTGYMAAVTLANKPYDLVLLERARLLASRHALSPGDDLVASYRLFPGQAEDFRFSLHDMAGHGIIAIGRLPKPRPLDYQIQAPQWRDTQYQGRKLRLVTFRLAIAGGNPVPCDGGPARRATTRHGERPLRSLPSFRNRTDHGRDHHPCLLDHNGVADADVLAPDLILIVESCPRDGRAR